MTDQKIGSEGIEQLAAAALSGIAGAEEKLFSALHERFCLIAQHRIWRPGKDPAEIGQDAEDISIEAIVTVILKYKKAEFPKGFVPWAYEILRNKIGGHYRRQETGDLFERPDRSDDDRFRKDTPSLGRDNEDGIDIEELIRKAKALLAVSGPQPAGMAYTSEEEILNAFRRLTPACLKIMILLIQGYKNSEVRDITGYRSIDVRIHRCRERMKALLPREAVS
jgi:RNA polymerase sigma factor (sigma-70 family)